MGTTRCAAAAFAAIAIFALGGCGPPSLAAPTEPGVCWHLVRVEGEYRFNRLEANQTQLEECAARLEEMRLRFMRLGVDATDIVGAYQGQFLFLRNEGVFTARNLTSTRYLAMVRTGDGRLVIPGAVQIN